LVAIFIKPPEGLGDGELGLCIDVLGITISIMCSIPLVLIATFDYGCDERNSQHY
jgi:hypothetical protein